MSKIFIKIDGMEDDDNFQISYKNTAAIDGNLIESVEYSNMFKASTIVLLKMNLLNF